nr:hypothetical protein [Tanacetum cinerariifolium]
MEAHLAPKQPFQVNKITSSCEICSGPHDAQYRMENPEQAFVDYASSRTDEAGGKCFVCLFLPNRIPSLINPNPRFDQHYHNVFKATDKPHGHDIIMELKKMEEPKDTPQKGSDDPTIINELESDGIKKEKKLVWLDIEEPLDLVDTCEESVDESLIKEIPRIILSKDDYDMGCERPSDLESGLYKDVDKLGLEHQPRPEESNSRSEVNNKGEVM